LEIEPTEGVLGSNIVALKQGGGERTLARRSSRRCLTKDRRDDGERATEIAREHRRATEDVRGWTVR
jgi:hypothetical protein